MVTVGERIVKLETKIDTVQDDITEIKSMVGCLDKKFAGKWIEKITIATMLILIGVVVKIILGV